MGEPGNPRTCFFVSFCLFDSIVFEEDRAPVFVAGGVPELSDMVVGDRDVNVRLAVWAKDMFVGTTPMHPRCALLDVGRKVLHPARLHTENGQRRPNTGSCSHHDIASESPMLSTRKHPDSWRLALCASGNAA